MFFHCFCYIVPFVIFLIGSLVTNFFFKICCVSLVKSEQVNAIDGLIEVKQTDNIDVDFEQYFLELD